MVECKLCGCFTDDVNHTCKKKITVASLGVLHKSGRVAFTEPTDWEVLSELPDELITAWKEYLVAKDKHIAMLRSYGILTLK